MVLHPYCVEKTELGAPAISLYSSRDCRGSREGDLTMSSPTTSGGSGTCPHTGALQLTKGANVQLNKGVSYPGSSPDGSPRPTASVRETSGGRESEETVPRPAPSQERCTTTPPTHPHRSLHGQKTPPHPGKPHQNILIPWKKRPLKTGSTNFHSIADLVTPSSQSESGPACVTSRISMLPENTHSLSHPATTSMTSLRHVDESLDLSRGARLTAEVADSSVKVGVRNFEEDVDVGAPDCNAVLNTSHRRNTISDLSYSTSDPHPCPPPSPISSSLSPGALTQDSPSVSTSPPAPPNSDAETADPNRLRKGRTIYKAQQVYVLEQVFSRTHYPDPEVIETLSRELDISENKIKVWFQNKRARWRRRAAETGLPPQPIGFTLSGAPGIHTSWPHHTSLPAGVLMPQPMYSTHYGGPQVAPRPAFPHMGHLTSLGSSPLYLGFDSSIMHPSAKGISGPAILPYGNYPMPVLPTPAHVWGDSPKLPGT